MNLHISTLYPLSIRKKVPPLLPFCFFSVPYFCGHLFVSRAISPTIFLPRLLSLIYTHTHTHVQQQLHLNIFSFYYYYHFSPSAIRERERAAKIEGEKCAFYYWREFHRQRERESQLSDLSVSAPTEERRRSRKGMRVIALSLRSARNPFDVEWRRFEVRGEEEEEFSTGQNVEEDKDI